MNEEIVRGRSYVESKWREMTIDNGGGGKVKSCFVARAYRLEKAQGKTPACYAFDTRAYCLDRIVLWKRAVLRDRWSPLRALLQDFSFSFGCRSRALCRPFPRLFLNRQWCSTSINDSIDWMKQFRPWPSCLLRPTYPAPPSSKPPLGSHPAIHTRPSRASGVHPP